ncbi:MAG: hypothetical protein LBD99_02445 [Candidatus Margulisbacteria bacterium]|nr:hypothetical protein [Candidatus Margulisiibacteriota bacterium]
MYKKIIFIPATLQDYGQTLRDMCEQVFDRLYSLERAQLRDNNPAQLNRMLKHYDLFWENIVCLKDYTADSLRESRRGIFKIFNEAAIEDGLKYLAKTRLVFARHEDFLTAATILHDLGKFIADADHPAISLRKFQDLCASDFHELMGTDIYPYLSAMDQETRYIMGLLIYYHGIGGISFEGNLGVVQQLKKDYALARNLPLDEFLDILVCFVALDKASVANAAGDGFLSWYDIQRLQKMLHSMLVEGHEINTLEDWADMVTNQFIMNYSLRQQAYNVYYPLFEQIALNYFAEVKESFLRQIRNNSNQAPLFGYVNSYLFHFAWNGDVGAILNEKMAKNGELFTDITVLTRFFLIKTAVVFFYTQEKEDLDRTVPYAQSGQKNIFAVKSIEDIYRALLDYLKTGEAVRILNIAPEEQNNPG